MCGVWGQRDQRISKGAGFSKEPFRGLQYEFRDRDHIRAATEAKVPVGLITIAGLLRSPIAGSCDAGVRNVAGVNLHPCYQQQ